MVFLSRELFDVRPAASTLQHLGREGFGISRNLFRRVVMQVRGAGALMVKGF
jgi:hypothetical protein